MELTAIRGDRGFTLVEALVALVILAIILFGLLAGLLISLQYNLLNFMREEAGSVAQECIENMRSTPFANIPVVNIDCNDNTTVNVSTPCLDTSGANVVTRQVRNTNVNYRVGWTVTDRTNIKELYVEVCWTYRERNYSYETRTFIGR
ncbi:type IV pilus assembly protein PilV [Hydrogenivirga caldilitoris]|uniref:Type IV pilus assembly protein PilV n=1 Tax=Hydrogenivirga caldilitoris TaxID=246264 RepID=A0A497XW76_9AQUI|nr:prepilin-type N-terminal cleavage/methylation domain-containing protein [Hydrogenivirga caldilitoris]RLJ71023.1 type IV pilus assembly protein PilV [Hydrogenivirga caldilitoris]